MLDAESILTPEVLSSLSLDAAVAPGLPGRAYGVDFYEIEQQKLFPRLWCVVGIASELPEPGDVIPVDLAGWPLVIVRDEEHRVRVFHNICRHRAMRLVNEPGKLRGGFVCPWHAWRYALDGRLLATPRVGGENVHRQAGLDPHALGLVAVRSATWLDFVFVNIDGSAPPFDEHIAPLEGLLSDYDLSGLERAEQWSVEYPGNWKVAVEGAIEDYHLPVGHPQLVASTRRWNPRLDYADKVFFSNSTAREYSDAGAANVVANLRSGLPLIPYAGDEPVRRSYFMNVFPTGMFQMHGDNAVQGMFLPTGAERTRLYFHHYFQGKAACDPAYRAERASIKQEWQKVFEQDIPFVQQVHENYKLRDSAGVGTRFSPFWEANILYFQRSVARAIMGEDCLAAGPVP